MCEHSCHPHKFQHTPRMHEGKEIFYHLAWAGLGPVGRKLLSICKSQTGIAVVPLSQWAVNVHCSPRQVVNVPSTLQPLSTPPRDPLPGSDLQPLVCAIHGCPWAGPTLPSVYCPRNCASQETLALTLMILTYLLNCIPCFWIIVKP